MLTVSPARAALHAELATLAAEFFAAREAVAPVEAVEPSTPAVVTCDGSKGWGTRYLASGRSRRVLVSLKLKAGPYFAAWVATSMRKGFDTACTSFHFPLAVTPQGIVCGAAQAYRSSPDLPVSHLS
jgi:hypothetical protein